MDSSEAIHYDDDEPMVIDLEEATVPAEGELDYDEDDPNLVTTFLRSEKGRSALLAIEEHVCNEFQKAEEASAGWRTRWMKDWSLFAGELPQRTGKAQGMVQINVPLSLENTTRVAFRLHAEIFDDYKNMVTVAPLGDSDVAAEALTKHSNWQFRADIPDFDRQAHRLCLAFTHIGDVTVHSFYDQRLQQNRHEVLTPDEFVVPWSHTTTMPDYSDLPWYAKVCSLYTHEMQAMEHWERVDQILQDYQPTFDDEPSPEGAEKVNSLQGQEQNTETVYAPHKVLWWEGWVNLPGQKRQRFVQGHLHYKSRKLMALTIHEEPHWKDLARYEQQQAEAEIYEQQRQAWEGAQEAVTAELDKADQAVDLAADAGMAGPGAALESMSQIAEERERMTGQLGEMEPEPPEWMSDDRRPEPARRVPIHSFTHMVCIEPLVGNRGLSYGRIQADLQRAVNQLVTQFADAGSFANFKPFMSSRKFQALGELKWGPGEINVLDAMDVEDIRKVIMPMSTGQANPQLMEIANLLMEKAMKSMQAAEILSGEPGKSGETYKGVAARIEQATKQLSVIGRKLGAGVKQIIRNNARLNSIYLPDDELVRIADLEGAPEVRISAGMYQRGYSFELRADMRFATSIQKIQEADEVLQMVMGLAQPGGPLMGNLALQYEVIKGAFVARRRPDLVALLGQKPETSRVFGPPPPPTLPPAGGPAGSQSSPTGPPGGGTIPGGQQ